MQITSGGQSMYDAEVNSTSKAIYIMYIIYLCKVIRMFFLVNGT